MALKAGDVEVTALLLAEGEGGQGHGASPIVAGLAFAEGAGHRPRHVQEHEHRAFAYALFAAQAVLHGLALGDLGKGEATGSRGAEPREFRRQDAGEVIAPGEPGHLGPGVGGFLELRLADCREAPREFKHLLERGVAVHDERKQRRPLLLALRPFVAVGRAQDTHELFSLVCGVLGGLRGYRELLHGARVALQRRGAVVVCGLVLGLAVYEVGLLGLYGVALGGARRVYHLGHVDRSGHVSERAEHEVGDRVS